MFGSKISVIVPIYNGERYLHACIESIVCQTYKNLEILLVDDGSTDSSLEICMKYSEIDQRIKVIHQDNKGVSAARNNGLDHMTGEFFSFVDSDDELKECALELLMKDILENKADLASAVFDMVSANGEKVAMYEDHALHMYSKTDMLCLSLEGNRQTNPVWAKLFKYDFFRNIRFVEGKSINEDGFYLFQCYTLKPTVVQHNESIYLYYVREGSVSRAKFSDKYFDMLYFCERKKEIVNQYFPEFSEKLITMEVSANLFFLDALCRTKDKKYRESQKNSINLVKKYYRQFNCINQHERKMAWIVAHGLYPAYKEAVYFRYYR